MRLFLVSLSSIALLGAQACASANGDPARQTEGALLGSADAPTMIVACTDVEYPSIDAALTVDANYRFSWKIGELETKATTLTRVMKYVHPEFRLYTFQLASGDVIKLVIKQDETWVTFFDAAGARCSPKAIVRESALEAAIGATASSLQRKQTFATCRYSAGGSKGDETFTVRPSLDESGAIFEVAGYEHVDQPIVLLARQRTQSISPPRTTYKGEGGLILGKPGELVSPFTELTFSGASPATVQWDWREEIPSNTCDVTGADYAASLIP